MKNRIYSLMIMALIFVASVAKGAGWLSPDSHEDPMTNWVNETLSYDGNQTTYASDSPQMGWGEPLVLNFSSDSNGVLCSRLRVYSDFGFDHVDEVRVEVYNLTNTAWETVHEGTISHSLWTEIEFSQRTIDAVRYRFHYIQDNWIFWLYELEVYEDPPVVSLPVPLTDAATSVEEYTAILQGRVSDDGGEPCEYRFIWGIDTNLSESTDWGGNKYTSNTFTHVLTGLVDKTLYYYRAQLRNSQGTNAGDEIYFLTGEPEEGAWLSATGFEDLSGNWFEEENLFDDHNQTWARCAHDIGSVEWSPWIYLTHAQQPIACNGIRLMGRGGVEIDLAQVDIGISSGVWETVYSNTMPNMEWITAEFAGWTVSVARVRFRISDTNLGLDWQLNEFDFRLAGGYTRWQTEWFDTRQDVLDNGNFESDPDGDDLINLSEYAFGTDPQSFDLDANLLSIGSQGSELFYTRRKDTGDVKYTIMRSGDLYSGSWSDSSDWIISTGLWDNVDGFTESVLLGVDIPEATNRIYFRVKAELIP